MPGSDEDRAERMEARVVPEARAAIESAAAAQETASRAIADASLFRLSAGDRRAISDGVLFPPPPNDALRRAAAAHRRLPG